MNTLAEDSFAITMPDIVRYAGASGDFTAIHYDADVLAAAGYDRFFAMGMLTAGRLGALVTSTFGDESVRELRVRFRERAWLGSRITLTITEDAPAGQGGDRRVLLTARTERDHVIVDGDAVVRTTSEDRA